MLFKPTGEVHITTNFMALNKSIIPGRYPLPLPEEIFQKTRGSSFFSKLDIVKGYHQIELKPSESITHDYAHTTRTMPQMHVPQADRLRCQFLVMHRGDVAVNRISRCLHR